jgi:broad specificity phosphatase PhoE
MSRFIDFIRHGDAMLPRGITEDRRHILSILGNRQAEAFGKAREQAGETYGLALCSDTLRTEGTLIAMKPFLGSKIREVIVPELFDPEEPDKYSRIRQAAYAKLGPQPLSSYATDKYFRAMTFLGKDAREALTPMLNGIRENILVLGHSLYTNQIILSTFNIMLSQGMRDRLLDDPPLEPCAGYRLVFHDDGSLCDMLRLPPIVLDI